MTGTSSLSSDARAAATIRFQFFPRAAIVRRSSDWIRRSEFDATFAIGQFRVLFQQGFDHFTDFAQTVRGRAKAIVAFAHPANQFRFEHISHCLARDRAACLAALWTLARSILLKSRL